MLLRWPCGGGQAFHAEAQRSARICALVVGKLFRRLFVADVPVLGQHSLMQDAGDENPFCNQAIEDHVAAVLHAAQAGTDIVAGAAQRRIIGECLTTHFQSIEVTAGLSFSPCSKSIVADCQQVGFGAPRKLEKSHGQRDFWGRLSVFRTRAKTLPLATPLASPASTAARIAASFA
jgi:hypothetical protein